MNFTVYGDRVRANSGSGKIYKFYHLLQLFTTFLPLRGVSDFTTFLPLEVGNVKLSTCGVGTPDAAPAVDHIQPN